MAQLKSTAIIGNLSVTNKIVAGEIVANNNIKLGAGIITLEGQTGYITGTWLRSTANNALSSAATAICVQNGGWIYTRTPAEILSDIGALTSGSGDMAFASGSGWSSLSIGKKSNNGILTLYKGSSSYLNLQVDGTPGAGTVLKLPAAGGTVATQGWVENKGYLTSHQSLASCAKIQTWNDLVHSGNEITMIPSAYSGTLWFNYRTCGNAGSLTDYIMGDGNKGQAAVQAKSFKITNGSSTVKATWQYNSTTDCVELAW